VCLSIGRVSDDNVDCLGGTDEEALSTEKLRTIQYYTFYCINQSSNPCITSNFICNGCEKCKDGDDEQFCNTNRTLPYHLGICESSYLPFASDTEKFICNYMKQKNKPLVTYFTVHSMSELIEDQTKNAGNMKLPTSSIIQMRY
jgi:hypothetical protein